MVCTSPLFAVARLDPCSGKKSLKFMKHLYDQFRIGVEPDCIGLDPNLESIIKLPCGQCLNCRLQRSVDTATRCVHESLMHEQNCFITLTYDDEHLPEDGSLNKAHVQDFFKRLKLKFGRTQQELDSGILPIRQLYSGEYGDITFRPHYHAIIFGIDFSHDRKKWKRNGDYWYYISESLSKLWKHGHAIIGDFSFDTAAYVARYCVKKVNGTRAHAHYKRIDKNGDEYFLQKEFAHSSNRPGLGRPWFDRFSSTDVLARDRVCIDRGDNRGYSKPPRYYDKLLEQRDPEAFKLLKEKRTQLAADASDNPDVTFRRLSDRAECTRLRMKNFVREINNGVSYEV